MCALFATAAGQPMPHVLAQMLLIVGIVAIGVILTISIRGKIARKDAARPAPRERVAQARTRHRFVDDRHAVEAQMQDAARHYAALMDNKAERLEQLIAEAERAIADLHQLAASAGRNGHAASSLPAPESAAAIDEAERIARELEAALPDAGTSAETASDPQAAPATPSPPPDRHAPTSPADRRIDPLTRSVYELADAGHDPVSIAQVLDEQIGKVELILALRES